MIKTVIRSRNDIVLVFDENGEQMSDYQGAYDEVKEKILADARADVIFNHWFGYSLKPLAVTVELW